MWDSMRVYVSAAHLPWKSIDISLYPPIGTCYFKSYTHEVSVTGAGTATLSVTFYIYVTQAKPTDPKFPEKGRVYIIVLWNGSAVPKNKTAVNYGVEFLSSSPTQLGQQPIHGADETHQDTTTYSVNFSQNLNMYNNGGNTGFTFPAKAIYDFSLYGYYQDKYPPVGWSIYWAGKTGGDPRHSLNGFQVFATSTLGVSKCKLYCQVGSQYESKEFSLDYSVATMNEAVVG